MKHDDEWDGEMLKFYHKVWSQVSTTKRVSRFFLDNEASSWQHIFDTRPVSIGKIQHLCGPHLSIIVGLKSAANHN